MKCSNFSPVLVAPPCDQNVTKVFEPRKHASLAELWEKYTANVPKMWENELWSYETKVEHTAKKQWSSFTVGAAFLELGSNRGGRNNE